MLQAGNNLKLKKKNYCDTFPSAENKTLNNEGANGRPSVEAVIHCYALHYKAVAMAGTRNGKITLIFV